MEFNSAFKGLNMGRFATHVTRLLYQALQLTQRNNSNTFNTFTRLITVPDYLYTHTHIHTHTHTHTQSNPVITTSVYAISRI